MIYLDNAATTFPKPEEVYAEVDFAQRNLAVNVGRGSYALATKAMDILEETRQLMAELIGVDDPYSVVITPSATIAANEIVYGLSWDKLKNVYVTPFEHNAVARPVHKLCSEYQITEFFIPFDPETHEWDEEETERLFLITPPDYVFLNHVSNVTGTVIPVEKIAKLAKSFGATIIVDGSQSVGLLDYNLRSTDIDYLIFAGHKNLYASLGVGGWVSNGAALPKPLLSGGTGSDSLNLSMSPDAPVGFEPGSHNIVAIASLNASIKWIKKTGIDVIAEKKHSLTKRLIAGLEGTTAQLYLPANNANHVGVISFTHPDYDANEVGLILSLDYDIAVRTGFHCAPYVHDFLGTTDKHGTVRASVGFFNSDEDIDALVQAIKEI